MMLNRIYKVHLCETGAVKLRAHYCTCIEMVTIFRYFCATELSSRAYKATRSAQYLRVQILFST